MLGVGLFAMAARSITDPDVWWHLRTGELIVATHSVPHSDPFSFTRFGQPWVAHEWLSDVLIYSLYRVAGWGGLIVPFGAITAAALLLTFLRCSGRPYVAAITTIWAAAASAPTWGVRPQMLSFLLASLFLLILERASARPRLIWWTLPLILLWLNLHAEFALGIALMLLFFAGTAMDVALGFEPPGHAKPFLRHLGWAIVACFALVPLNPNGSRMYWYPVETLRSTAMQSYINEWFSPNFHQLRHLPFLLMVLGIVAALPVSGRRLRPRELLLLLVVTAAGLHSTRHIAIFALVATPILSSQLEGWLKRTGLSRRLTTQEPAPGRLRLALHAGVLLALLGFTFVRVAVVLRQQAQLEGKRFPSAAVSFLTEQRPPGPLLNHYDWGGYLIWKLYPQYLVYVDGRADLYGDAFLYAHASSFYLTDDWRKTLEHWHIQTVLLPPGAPLVNGLLAWGGWKQIYGDGQAVILTRSR